MIKPFLITNLFLILCNFTIASFASDNDTKEQSLASYTPVLSDELKALLKTADLAEGKEYFMRKCSSCHDEFKSDTHGKGPNLWNVFGRKAGTSDGFEYSEAMQQSGHTWNFATLNYYLTRTERAVPGRSMNFKGIRQDKYRAKLLLFLRSMNDVPPELP